MSHHQEPRAGGEPDLPPTSPSNPEAPLAAGKPSDPSTPTLTSVQAPPPIVPPQVLERVPAQYPQSMLESSELVVVELIVTVSESGTVTAAEVVQSAGEAFDRAALTAIVQWRFSPARRGEVAVTSRIRVPFRFDAPKPADTASSLATEAGADAKGSDGQPIADPSSTVPPGERGSSKARERDGVGSQTPPREAAPMEPPGPRSPAADEASRAIDVTVQGEIRKRTEERSSGDFHVERDVVVAAPRQEGAEVLRTVPGLYIGRSEGPAVAHNYMLRGFDAEHGQDIEFRVGGIPINLPSHLHGQGYADLGFLLGDVVRELSVSEGTYDPRQGDFAVAGSIDVGLGVDTPERGVRARSSYGSFRTFRQTLSWAPRKAHDDSFGAVQYMRTQGFGQNRAGQSASGIVQHRFGHGKVSYRVLAIVHAARSALAGVVRKDDIDAGEVCFHCVYDHPTAQAQNAAALRFLAGAFADHRGDGGANGHVGLWGGYDSFRLQENFTGFLQRSQTLANVAGRGDLIEQQNRTVSVGLTGRYRTASFRPADWAQGTIEVGADARLDVIDQAQNLLDAGVRNQTWDRRVDAEIRGMDFGFWGDLDWSLTRVLQLRLGFRADVLAYDIEDALANFAEAVRPQDAYITGFRRSAMGVAAGPRTSVEVRPLDWLGIVAAYGEGYRSPQARQLEDGEDAPFTKVRSADFGLRFDLGNPLALKVGGYYTHLSDDVVFDASEGRLERIGATQRLGAVAALVTRPTSWLVGSVSFTFVDATLLEPPPATAEDPNPAFTRGQNLPFVPPFVVRADVGARHVFVANMLGSPFGGRVGVGFSLLSPRPLPFGEFAQTVALLDASVGLTWGPVDLAFEVFNALDSHYAAVEYNFVSNWDPQQVPSRTPARHIAAGAPFSWLLSLGVAL